MDAFDDFVTCWAELGHERSSTWDKLFQERELPPHFPKGPLSLEIFDDKGEKVAGPRLLEPKTFGSRDDRVKFVPVEYRDLPTVIITHYCLIDHNHKVVKHLAFSSAVFVTSEDTLRITVNLEFRDLGISV